MTDNRADEAESAPDASSDESRQKENERQDEVLSTARARWKIAVEAESQFRKEALDDLKFVAGDQWPQDIKQQRELDRRPCITINRIPQFVRQITNDQRQNRPSIKVSPVGDGAQQETAKIFQGLIRHIEVSSNADVAYDTGFESAVRQGLGFMRVVTDYCDPYSFDQDIFIKRIRNSFSVYIDPHFQEADGSDMGWAFVFEDLSKDDFKAKYPNSKLASMTDWQAVGDLLAGWTTTDTIRVAEYFFKTFKRVNLLQLSSGEVIEEGTVNQLPPGVTVVNTRETVLPAIRWVKMNAVEILEETDWLGQYIPVVPILGEELDIEGKRVLEGIVRHAKDPQRMYNFWASSETETIALAPRAPFIGVEGQFEGFEDQWRTANIRNHAFLQYKAKSIGGVPAPPPQRQSYEPPVMAITQARMNAAEDLKATTGIYDASLGNRSNEQSGVAIQNRNRQAQTNNFHYIDNFSRAQRYLGRILLDLIPKVYDTARASRIIGEDGQEEMVMLNQIFEHKGKQVNYNLSVGRYDVTVDTGPSYATKRQEAVASMLDLSRSNPQVAQVAGDLMVKNMDWPGASEIADRLKKTLPPGMADDPKNKIQIPPQIQAQMQQMNQMIEGLTQQLNHKTEQINQKTLELESRERIEMAKIQAAVEMKLADLGSKEAITLLGHEIEEIRSRLELIKMDQPIGFENGAGPEGAAPQEAQQQPPTGGLPPG